MVMGNSYGLIVGGANLHSQSPQRWLESLFGWGRLRRTYFKLSTLLNRKILLSSNQRNANERNKV